MRKSSKNSRKLTKNVRKSIVRKPAEKEPEVFAPPGRSCGTAAATAAAAAAAAAAANGTWALAAPPGAAAVLPTGEYVLSLSSEPDGAAGEYVPAARRRCASFALLIDIIPTSWVDDYPQA